jgi:hypothetical protein
MKLHVNFSRAAAISMMVVAGSSPAAEPGAEQAEDLLNKAVAYQEKVGPARAFCAFNDPSGEFHKGPLYVFAINMDGIYFAHSAAPTLVGVSLRDTKDAAGKPLERTSCRSLQVRARVRWTTCGSTTLPIRLKRNVLSLSASKISCSGWVTTLSEARTASLSLNHRLSAAGHGNAYTIRDVLQT